MTGLTFATLGLSTRSLLGRSSILRPSHASVNLLSGLMFIYVDVLLFSMSKGRSWHGTYAVRVLPSRPTL